jgi:threonine synthase
VTNKLPRLIRSAGRAVYLPDEAFVNDASQIEPTPHVQSISADGQFRHQPAGAPGAPCSKRSDSPVAGCWRSNEAEVLAAHTALAARGIFAEPTSATVAAALQQLPPSTLRPNASWPSES